MLEDGSIRAVQKMVLLKGNAQYGITSKYSSKDFIISLLTTIFYSFRPSLLRPWPNLLLPQHITKSVQHYHSGTGCTSLQLYKLW